MTHIAPRVARPRTRAAVAPTSAEGLASALRRRPVTAWAVYLVLLGLIALSVTALWPDLGSGADGLSTRQVAVQALLTLLPLPAAAALGWRVIGFRRPQKLLLAAFPAATVGFGYVAPAQPQALTTVALAVLLVLLVAFGEEIAFRGVLLHLLLPRGAGVAVALSSLLFGLTHTVNLLLGAPPAGVLLQVFFAGTGAAGFAAIRIRTGSLWPGIVLHAGYDLAFRVTQIDPSTWHGRFYYTLHGIGWLIFAVVVLRGGHGSAAQQRSKPAGARS
jgi:membrane protease YdiL (CAAX protease family)